MKLVKNELWSYIACGIKVQMGYPSWYPFWREKRHKIQSETCVNVWYNIAIDLEQVKDVHIDREDT